MMIGANVPFFYREMIETLGIKIESQIRRHIHLLTQRIRRMGPNNTLSCPASPNFFPAQSSHSMLLHLDLSVVSNRNGSPI
jgi:hypothetical protein